MGAVNVMMQAPGAPGGEVVSKAVSVDVSEILAPYADRLTTRTIVLESGLLARSAGPLKASLPEGPWLLVADEKTLEVAGQAVIDSLKDAGVSVSLYLVEPAAGESVPVANDAKVELLRAHLTRAGQAAPPVAVVAVGAGTVNDIAKMATFQAGIPYAVVGTAPSMNGYTSAIAAILSEGVKVTLPCHAPVACLADLDVMAQAPYRMIASGFGDLISKPVSNADWRLSFRLLGSHYSPETIKLVEQGFALLEGIAPRLRERDPEAVGRLTGTLCVSGLAMAVAGSSAPASGGEHLISHYIDMTHFAFGQPHDFHGCQVGVGTITTAALYEKLTAMNPDDIDVEARVAALAPVDAYEEGVREHFGVLSEAVVGHMRNIYPTPEVLRTRLSALKAQWSSIIEDVNGSLRPAASIRDELVAAGCPVTFAEIDVDDERARRATVHCKDIRARYTILHLAFELGVLDAWADDVLENFHGIASR